MKDLMGDSFEDIFGHGGFIDEYQNAFCREFYKQKTCLFILFDELIELGDNLKIGEINLCKNDIQITIVAFTESMKNIFSFTACYHQFDLKQLSLNNL